MKNLHLIKEILRGNKSRLREEFHVKKLGIFGSYTRREQNPLSDIDILVEFKTPPDFFGFLRLEGFLKKILGIKVDLVTPKALKPFIKQRILQETIFL